MICYMDRAWCLSSNECANAICFRHFGDDDRERAEIWWGGKDFPVSWSNFRTDECGFQEKKYVHKRSNIRQA